MEAIDLYHEGENNQSQGHAKYLEKFDFKVTLKKPIGDETINIQEYSTSEKHAYCCPKCKKPIQLEYKICPYCRNDLKGK